MLLKELELDLPKILSDGIRTLEFSHSPYSGFRVAATAISNNKKRFTACNIENASYSLTVCAEVAAICKMVSTGEKELGTIFIFSDSEQFVTPCGACRQTILEFSTSDIPIYLINSKENVRTFNLSFMLPNAFNHEDLESINDIN